MLATPISAESSHRLYTRDRIAIDTGRSQAEARSVYMECFIYFGL